MVFFWDPNAYQLNLTLGNSLYIIIGITAFLGLALAILSSIRAHNSNPASCTESQTPHVRKKRPTAFKTFIRRQLLLPALFGTNHVQPVGWFNLPTRGQSFMVFFYLLFNILLMVLKYPEERSVKAVADRAGHLAIANMPIYFLLAGRNNVLIFLTGWAYKDFQVFHKWIARTSALEMIVHGAAYGWKAAKNANGGLQKMHGGQVWWNGIAAICALVVLILFSVFPIRRRAYEIFLVTHIIGAAMFIYFLYRHVAPSTHPYNAYIWACTALWALDRTLRFLRLVIFNLRGRHTAYARIIPATDVIKLSVYPTISDVGFAPGAHYFIYIPDRWCFWESHPFTAAAWRSGKPTGKATSTSYAPPEKVAAALERFKDENYGSSGSGGEERRHRKGITVTTRAGPKRSKLTFLIHPRRGLTHNLQQRILDSPTREIEFSCLLEGPYGNLRPVHAFPTVVVIAGGVGIATALPYLKKHLHHQREPHRRFVLIWTVREAALAENVLREIRGLSFRPDVAVKLYVTGENEKLAEKENWRLPVGVSLKYKRPKIVKAVVKEGQGRVGGTPMAVIACGSGGVVDAAREGAVKALGEASGKKGMGEVLYWEESHGW